MMNGQALTGFTKWTFVWDKNPQRRHIPYYFQLFILNMNISSILNLKQRFRLYVNFHFPQEFYLYIFFVYYHFFLNVANFITNHTTSSKMKTKTSHWKSATILLLTGRCRAKFIQNEKLKYKIKRWMNFKMDTIFMLGMKN